MEPSRASRNAGVGGRVSFATVLAFENFALLMVVIFGFLSSAFLFGSAASPVLSGFVAGRSIRVVFLTGVVILALIVLLVRRHMAERAPAIVAAPAVDES